MSSGGAILVAVTLLTSCPWKFVNLMYLSAPDICPNFLDKQISHRGRVIQEGGIVQSMGTWQHPLSWTSVVLQTFQTERLGLPVGITSLVLL